MAAPNIVGITTLVGITTYISNIGVVDQVILSNASNSNRVFRVISLIASNKTGAPVLVSASYWSQAAGAGTSISIAREISVPSGSTLIVVGRDSPLYIEENRSITVYAGSTNSIDIISSYESIG